MGDSIQEQLLALGLAKKRAVPDRRGGKGKATAGKSERHVERKTESGKRKASPPRMRTDESELSLKEAYRLREQQSREESERTRKEKRAEQRRRRELNQNIRAIVDSHRLNDPAADLPRNFLHNGRIRKVHVTADQLKGLNEGSMGLVYLAGGHYILQSEFVEQVRRLSAENVADMEGGEDEDGQYPVPEDLHW